MKTHKIEHRQIDSLKFAEYNPRKISPEELEKLKNSLKEFGFVQPAVINKDGVIIGGHQRIKAAKELGIKEVPCAVLDIDKKKEKILNLALNKISGEWDEDKLKKIFEQLQSDTSGAEDILLTGFDSTEIDLLFREDDPDVQGLTKDDDAPDINPAKPPRTKKGDVYKLGEHFLICGDSTDAETYSKVFEAAGIKEVAMTFTDPPYNVDYEGSDGEKIQNDKMTKRAFGQFLKSVVCRILENTKGACYVCMSNSEIDQLKREWESNGGNWSNFIIWAKNSFVLGRSDYHYQFELILYGWAKKKTNHYFCGQRNIGNVWQQKGINIEEKPDGTYRVSFDDPTHKRMVTVNVSSLADIEVDGKDILDVWNIEKPPRNTSHPTMKPVELVSRAIKNSSKHGDWVLDAFGGSGSTMIACEKTGRKNISIELDPVYCDAILQRYEEFTGLSPEKL